MTSTPPSIVEAAVKAVRREGFGNQGADWAERYADAVLEAVVPLLVAEGYDKGYRDGDRAAALTFEPEAIRAEAVAGERQRLHASIRSDEAADIAAEILDYWATRNGAFLVSSVKRANRESAREAWVETLGRVLALVERGAAP